MIMARHGWARPEYRGRLLRCIARTYMSLRVPARPVSLLSTTTMAAREKTSSAARSRLDRVPRRRAWLHSSWNASWARALSRPPLSSTSTSLLSARAFFFSRSPQFRRVVGCLAPSICPRALLFAVNRPLLGASASMRFPLAQSLSPSRVLPLSRLRHICSPSLYYPPPVLAISTTAALSARCPPHIPPSDCVPAVAPPSTGKLFLRPRMTEDHA